MLIGIISDTHGLLRDEVFTIFRYCDLILHAGDIGNAESLEKLKAYKKLVAVRGNVDKETWAMNLKETEKITLLNKHILLIHNLNDLQQIQTLGNIDIVIYGHSHKAEIKYRNNILFFNPGSAGPRRFSLPVSLGLLTLKDGNSEARIINIPSSAP